MIKKLALSRLSNLESGQHVKNVHSNLTRSGAVTSPVLLQYMAKVKSACDAYDESLVSIMKSDETQKIFDADLRRDYALTTLKRAVSIFEFAEAENEKLAFASLETLFANYQNMQDWNYMEQTNGIDNLIADLQKDHYAPNASLFGLNIYIDRLKSANNVFKSLFQGRSMENTGASQDSSKNLRREMQEVYMDMAHYVLAMHKLPDAEEQFGTALEIINNERNYSSNLLARRSGGKDAAAPAAE